MYLYSKLRNSYPYYFRNATKLYRLEHKEHIYSDLKQICLHMLQKMEQNVTDNNRRNIYIEIYYKYCIKKS